MSSALGNGSGTVDSDERFCGRGSGAAEVDLHIFPPVYVDRELGPRRLVGTGEGGQCTALIVFLRHRGHREALVMLCHLR